MKTLFVIISFLCISSSAFAHKKVASDCTYKGHKLYGNVQIVTNFEDLRIKYVDNFEDLKVKFDSHFPTSCGRWKIVDNFPDLKVKIVDNFEDLRVKVVDNFEGI